MELTTLFNILPPHLPDVLLQPLDPVVADDEPELEGAKALAQGDLPVLRNKNNFFL